jgi:hypothetical protein
VPIAAICTAAKDDLYSITSAALASSERPSARRKPGLSSSRAQLVCEVDQVLRDHINRLLRNGCSSLGSKFIRSCDAGNAQANSLCSNDIGGMRRGRNHHAFVGRQIERFSGSEIDSRFWFVVASNLGAENGVETKLVAERDRPSARCWHWKLAPTGNYWPSEQTRPLRPATHPTDAKQGLSCASPRSTVSKRKGRSETKTFNVAIRSESLKTPSD